MESFNTLSSVQAALKTDAIIVNIKLEQIYDTSELTPFKISISSSAVKKPPTILDDSFAPSSVILEPEIAEL